jgi:hypothetical protein
MRIAEAGHDQTGQAACSGRRLPNVSGQGRNAIPIDPDEDT